MQEAKVKMTNYVNAYKSLYKDEFLQFATAQKVNQLNQKDKYSEVKGSEIIERKLGEIPETLYAIFKSRLEPSEFEWFRTTPGAHWFYKTFPEFSETKV